MFEQWFLQGIFASYNSKGRIQLLITCINKLFWCFRRRNAQPTKVQHKEISSQLCDFKTARASETDDYEELEPEGDGYQNMQATTSTTNTYHALGYLNQAGPGEITPSAYYNMPAPNLQTGSFDSEVCLTLNTFGNHAATALNPERDSQSTSTNYDSQGYLNPAFQISTHGHPRVDNQENENDDHHYSGIYEEIL